MTQLAIERAIKRDVHAKKPEKPPQDATDSPCSGAGQVFSIGGDSRGQIEGESSRGKRLSCSSVDARVPESSQLVIARVWICFRGEGRSCTLSIASGYVLKGVKNALHPGKGIRPPPHRPGLNAGHWRDHHKSPLAGGVANTILWQRVM